MIRQVRSTIDLIGIDKQEFDTVINQYKAFYKELKIDNERLHSILDTYPKFFEFMSELTKESPILGINMSDKNFLDFGQLTDEIFDQCGLHFNKLDDVLIQVILPNGANLLVSSCRVDLEHKRIYLHTKYPEN